MRVIGVVHAKSESERLPGKNGLVLGGDPLYLRALKTLMGCAFVDGVYLDTDSDDFIAGAERIGARVLRRPDGLCDNATDGNDLLRNFADQVDADVYVQLACTSPFITSDTVDEAVRRVRKGAAACFLATAEPSYSWRHGTPQYDAVNIPNSSDLPLEVCETTGLYAVRAAAFMQTGSRTGLVFSYILASPIEAIDINDHADWELAQAVEIGLREAVPGRSVAPTGITASLVADVLRDMGYPEQSVGMPCSPSVPAICGPATTLRLRTLRRGESPDGIYDALDSYRQMRPGSVIVVETAACDCAYFGELNARLAMRAGAVGTVVCGHTRDKAAVEALGYPVWSWGHTPHDVKGNATLDAINDTIDLYNMTVEPGQYIVADADGVVVIPPGLEDEVFANCREAKGREEGVIEDVAAGVDAKAIFGKRGGF